MTLTNGSKLGPYEIVAPIGAGGMGEVYRARDPRVGREVAIKVSSEKFSERFEREARAVAALNHPNICTLYDVGPDYIVMELVEGETLAERIGKGAIPLEEALQIARQIAEALEAAHEKGIIHRDLKPGNIKIRPDGTVKVLDFGLAKVTEPQDTSLSNSPTLSHLATQQGIILGTAGYMSPEQARGKPVDKRADIWAFGVVLYEMLTGKRLFEGDTVSDTLAAVLTKEPDLNHVPAKAGPLLRRCLEKDAKRRLRDIGEVAAWFDVATEPPPRSSHHPWLAWAITASLAVALGIALWAPWRKAAPLPLLRFSEELSADILLSTDPGPAIALSPDGSVLVLVAGTGLKPQLYLRRLDQWQAVPMPGTEDASCPFFSPDGQWIGFFADSKLKKVSITGGAAVTLCEAAQGRGGTWAGNESIVFAPKTQNQSLMRVSSAGGKPEEVAKLDPTETTQRWPQMLPGGKALLYTSHNNGRDFDNANLVVQSLPAGARKVIQRGGYYGRYLASGHLVYMHGGTLFAARFDLDRLEMIGQPAPILEGVGTSTRTGGAEFAVSGNGALVYLPGGDFDAGIPQNTLVWVDRKGNEEPLGAPPDGYIDPQLSPDGTRVVVTIGAVGLGRDLWIWDTVRKTMTRLTLEKGFNLTPLWTPDGKRIAYFSNSEKGRGVYWKAADGAGKEEVLFAAPNGRSAPSSWSKDGKDLVLNEATVQNSMDIGMLSMEGERKHKYLLHETYIESQAQISPDGRWMAYSSDESGQFQVYVRPFPNVDSGRQQVSQDGGDSPLWSRDSRELFYRSGDAVMAVSVKTGPALGLDTPRSLFSGKHLSFIPTFTFGLHPWDISLDGKRFLMIKPPAHDNAPKAPQRINIVLNWTEEMKQRVPVN